MKRVLFICTANACRSQMAEGLLKHLGRDVDVSSGGNEPTGVHPLAIRVMGEIKIDISKQRSKSVDEFRGEEFDYVITLCGETAKNSCPLFVGHAKQRLHWDFRDPIDDPGPGETAIDIFREVRDGIKHKIEELILEGKA